VILDERKYMNDVIGDGKGRRTMTMGALCWKSDRTLRAAASGRGAATELPMREAATMKETKVFLNNIVMERM
jgi:hypothetical protein